MQGGRFRKKSKKSANQNTFTVSQAAMKATVLVALIILSAGVVLWWQFIFTDAERTFEGMLNKSLNTTSVTRTVSQEAEVQSLEQVNRLQFGADTGVIGQTTITQEGEITAEVVTEEIGTPERDYVRYTLIETSEQDEDGEAIDFSDVVGVWGVSETPAGQPQNGESFSEAVLGVIPFASLTASERKELVQFALEAGVYDVDYLGVTRESENGRPIFTYPVMLQPEAYVSYLQQVAGAMGLTQLENVNPADFRGVAPIRFTVKVDILSRQPTELTYGAQNDRQEVLRDYGVLQPITIPDDPIPAIELQQRIQAAQQ